jgi:hypothetical protein
MDQSLRCKTQASSSAVTLTFLRMNAAALRALKGGGPYEACGCSIEQRTDRLLRATLAEVDPLYSLEKDGGFKRGDLRGIAFATARLAAGPRHCGT